MKLHGHGEGSSAAKNPEFSFRQRLPYTGNVAHIAPKVAIENVRNFLVNFMLLLPK